MTELEIFNKILEANCYCTYDRYKECYNCPYEKIDNCKEAIKADIEKVRERLETTDND